MPRRSSVGEVVEWSRSSIQIRPLVGSIIRLIMRRLVVLPHPEGPTRTVILPDGAVRLRLSTATVPSGYVFVTESKRIIATPPRLFDARCLFDGRCLFGRRCRVRQRAAAARRVGPPARRLRR